jgi:UDP:flavonoid glycosyltransferase YjiC (YdhE family)
MISAGIPQIVLALWFDTFDFAERVELLGIGINGSKHSAPKIDPEFLGKALVEITDEQNEKGKATVTRAKDLAKVMDRYKGRKAAADKILELSEL